MLAGSAAFFSVYGMAHLFKSQFIAIIILGLGLEAAKFTATVGLHDLWYRLNKFLKIYRFAEKLVEEEGPAILAWFLRGFQKLLVEVNNTGDIVIGDGQRRKVENLLAESDSVTHFIQDRVHKTHGATVTNDEFITLYGEYCAERGWVAMEQAKLQKVINQKMLELRQVTQSHSLTGRGKSKRGFRNISVDGQRPDEEFYGD